MGLLILVLIAALIAFVVFHFLVLATSAGIAALVAVILFLVVVFGGRDRAGGITF